MTVDKTLPCADCGQEFPFTASEQDFYAERGFTEPRRCASCRAARKAQRGDSGGSSYGGGSSYSSGAGSYGGGGSSYGGGASPRSGRRHRAPPGPPGEVPAPLPPL